MQGILLTQADGFIMGPISKVLGVIMNAIFNVLDFIGIPNIGVTEDDNTSEIRDGGFGSTTK